MDIFKWKEWSLRLKNDSLIIMEACLMASMFKKSQFLELIRQTTSYLGQGSEIILSVASTFPCGAAFT